MHVKSNLQNYFHLRYISQHLRFVIAPILEYYCPLAGKSICRVCEYMYTHLWYYVPSIYSVHLLYWCKVCGLHILHIALSILIADKNITNDTTPTTIITTILIRTSETVICKVNSDCKLIECLYINKHSGVSVLTIHKMVFYRILLPAYHIKP